MDIRLHTALLRRLRGPRVAAHLAACLAACSVALMCSPATAQVPGGGPGAAPAGVPPGAPAAATAGQQVFQRDRGPILRGRRVLAPVTTQQPVPWSADLLKDVTVSAAAEAAVTQLDSKDYAQREAGSRVLRSPSVKDEELYVLLGRTSLSTEQRAWVLDIAQQRILFAPRGALGIQMADGMDERDGVAVTGIVKGMPAEGVLQVGDRIIEINNVPIPASYALAEVVQNLRPGDRIKVVVMRGERDERGRIRADPAGGVLEKRTELEMPLGSVAELQEKGDARTGVRAVDGTRERLVSLLRATYPPERVQIERVRKADEPLNPDSHPDIVYLRQMVERRSDPTLDPGIRGLLNARLSQLEAAAEAPSLPADDRAWLQAVAARFRQLMEEARLRRPSDTTKPDAPPAPADPHGQPLQPE
ncbi:MAG: PDZ domain-containing protein [Phycisphaerales bacterium]